MVLLRNEGNMLPLTATAKKIAVIGPIADNATDIGGGGSAEGIFGGGTSAGGASFLTALKGHISSRRKSRMSPDPGRRASCPR